MRNRIIQLILILFTLIICYTNICFSNYEGYQPLLFFSTWDEYIEKSDVYEKSNTDKNRDIIENKGVLSHVKKLNQRKLKYTTDDIKLKAWDIISKTEKKIINHKKSIIIKDLNKIPKIVDDKKIFINLDKYNKYKKIRERNSTVGIVSGVKKIAFIPIHLTYSKEPYKIIIKPQYTFLDYDKNGYLAHLNYGIISNIKTIRKIKMIAAGIMLNQKVNLILEDNNGNKHSFFIGIVKHGKWRELIWENNRNLAFIEANKDDRRPIFPKEMPYYKFHSIELEIDNLQKSKNSFLLIHSIFLEYDKIYENEFTDEQLKITKDGMWDDGIWRENYRSKIDDDIDKPIWKQKTKSYGLESIKGIKKREYLIKKWQNILYKRYWNWYKGKKQYILPHK